MVKCSILSSSILFGGSLLAPLVSAQPIIPDNTLGREGSVVAPVDGVDLVTGGATRGPHLFHSFEAFSIDAGQAVYFDSPSGINNIFSRVTGSAISDIQGKLGVQGNASLFLLNPNGIVLGPGAELDISGSFVGSTAERFDFDEGLEFSAVEPAAPPLLNIVVQPGLQYGAASGEIVNQARLRVGQDLTLGAPRLEIAGELEAGRDIVLQGRERRLAGASYTLGGYWLAQDLTGDVVDVVIPHERVIVAEGDVQLNENYEGPSLYILAGGQVSQAEGVDQIEITGAVGGAVNETVGDGLGGTQSVMVRSGDAPVVDIRSGMDWDAVGRNLKEQNTAVLKVSLANKSGEDLTLENLSNANGTISLETPGNITLGSINTDVFVSSASTSEELAEIDAGNIWLSAGGNIKTEEIISSSFLDLESGMPIGGNGGNITAYADGGINTGYVSSASFLSASESFSGDSLIGGDGGKITLSANGDIYTTIGSQSALFDDSESSPLRVVGDGGDISISSGQSISILDDIDSASVSDLGAGEVIGGDGGDIHLLAEGDITYVLESVNAPFGIRASSTSVSSTFSSAKVIGGNAGNISLFSGGSIHTDRIVAISRSESGGEVIGGNGGNISLSAGDDIVNVLTVEIPSFVERESGIDSTSASVSTLEKVKGGNGGNISLFAGSDIRTEDLRSTSASFSIVEGMRGGNGGDISLHSGGDVRATTIDSFSLSESPDVVQGGNGGNVLIHSPSGSIQPLGEEFARLSLFSFSTSGKSGAGGSASLIAENKIQDIEVYTTSSSEQSGRLEVRGVGDLSISGLNIFTTKIVEIELPPPFERVIEFNIGEQGASGDIEIVGEKSLTFTDSNFQSDTNGPDDAGSYAITSPSLITFNNTQINNSTQSKGQAGDTTVNAAEIILDNNSSISSSTDGPGTAGDIILNAPIAITITGNGTLNAQTNAIGSAGNITIATNRFTLDQGTKLTTTATINARPPANTTKPSANITLNADEMNLFGAVEILSETQGSAQAGTLTLQPNTSNDLSIHLADQSRVSASTSGSGQGGSINLSAPNALSIQGAGSFSAETTGTGNGGNINLTARAISVDKTTISTSTNNLGKAGNITVNAETLTLINASQVSAKTQGEGDSGTIQLDAIKTEIATPLAQQEPDFTAFSNASGRLDITLDSQSEISVSTSGSGRGGNLNLNAPEAITITGNGTLSAQASATGSAGNITATTKLLSLARGTALSTTATKTATPPANEDGSSANITLNADEMKLFGTVKILSETQGSAQAGTLTLKPNTSDNLTIELADQSRASASTSGSGQGGSINLSAPNDLIIRGGGTFSAETTGAGTGGNINLNAQNVVLDEVTLQTRSALPTRNTEQGLAGNIAINNLQTLQMQNGSLILADAGGNADGGNITIDSDFVIARSGENNDIIATAVDGSGGRIDIMAEAILNFEASDEPNTDTLRKNSANDISASSQSGNDGTLNLAGLNADPTRGAAQLPGTPAPPNQTNQACSTQVRNGNNFTITGQGGTPPNPTQPLNTATPWTDWMPLNLAEGEVEATYELSHQAEALYEQLTPEQPQPGRSETEERADSHQEALISISTCPSK